jgi:hypothetical protein
MWLWLSDPGNQKTLAFLGVVSPAQQARLGPS